MVRPLGSYYTRKLFEKKQNLFPIDKNHTSITILPTMIQIGKVSIPTNILLAPMSGCTDLSLRLICREHGAKFCFFEMIDAHSLVYGNKKTAILLKTTPNDTPIAAQLLGAKPDLLCEAAHRLLGQTSVAFIDINSACPVRKVGKKGAGAYLLKTPQLLLEIIQKLSSAVNIPVTVKLRTGFQTQNIPGIVRLAQECEQHGAQALFIHGRTKTQGYSGEVDYTAIRKIKEAVTIPVFGSGNIFSALLAQKMFSETGCDGILVARGALGNPWIFEQINDALRGSAVNREPSFLERKETLKKHLSYICAYTHIHQNHRAGLMRKIALWYLKKIPHACRIRGHLIHLHTYQKFIDYIDSL